MKQQLGQMNWMDRLRTPAWLVSLAVVGGLSQVEGAIAHGVKMQYQTTQAIAIQAKYDTGAPFANAQVTVYAPQSNTPWLQGTTDETGRFTFTPDSSKPGTWQVKARLAGHGDILNLTVGAAAIPPTAAAPDAPIEPDQGGTIVYTPLQKGVMAASVIWGAIGTALFFWGRKR